MRAEIGRLRSEVTNLQPFTQFEGVTVNFRGYISMLDGKAINAWTNNDATSRCRFCKLTPSEFRGKREFSFELQVFEAIENVAMAILHFGLRCIHHLMRLSCLQKANEHGEPSYRMCGPHKAAKKKAYDDHWQYLTEKIKKEKGILLEAPSPQGGTTTKGNDVKKLFSDPKYLSDTFEIDFTFTNEVKEAWITLRCYLPLDSAKVKKKFHAIIDLYEALWPYAEMCATMHTALAHTHEVIDELPPNLALGHMNEEPMESSHHLVKDFEVNRTPQKSREDRVKGVFQRMADQSDPQILSIIESRQRTLNPNNEPYPKGVLDLV